MGRYWDIKFLSAAPHDYGGCVYTNHPVLSKLILSYRDWGRDCICLPGFDNCCGHRYDGKFGQLPQGYDHKYVYSHFGYNLKATDMQAAVGCEQLKKLPEFIKKRNRNWNLMHEKLSEVRDKIILPEPVENGIPSWFGFLITLKNGCKKNRGEVVRYIEAHNIQTRLLFGGNLLKHPCFDLVRNTDAYRVVGELRNTNYIMKNSFWVGVYPGLTDEMIQYVAEIIVKAVQ